MFSQQELSAKVQWSEVKGLVWSWLSEAAQASLDQIAKHLLTERDEQTRFSLHQTENLFFRLICLAASEKDNPRVIGWDYFQLFQILR